MRPPVSLALPRELEADPACETIRTRFAAPDRLLWPGGTATVPVLPLAPAGSALATEYGAGHLVLGFERITETLAGEAHGLAQVAHREPPRPRISRLLLLSDDGAERLYRHVAAVAAAHAPRVLVALLAADAAALGHAILGSETRVKVVLVRHKDAVAALMRALAA